MILEGIVTTTDEAGEPNISPMGPEVDADWKQVVLKPFHTSRTHANLRRSGQAVLHITDDVELLARAAVNRLDPLPPLRPAGFVEGFILEDTCRWYALKVKDFDDREERARILCDIVASGRQRDFFGFNRAKHAVVEAAILATRTRFLPHTVIRDEFQRLSVLVDKTGGERERNAFQFLESYVAQAASDAT